MQGGIFFGAVLYFLLEAHLQFKWQYKVFLFNSLSHGTEYAL